MTLALSGFIIPFSFAYDPAPLMVTGTAIHIAWRTAAATLGIVMLGTTPLRLPRNGRVD